MKNQKIYKGILDRPMHIKLVVEEWGREMSEFIWHWRSGNTKIYTKKIEVAEKAMKEGILVMGIREKPRIMKY